MTAEDCLRLFEEQARPWLDQLFKPNTCIEQTRILIEVLKRFGIQAEPLGTKFHLVCRQCGFQFFSSGDPQDRKNAAKAAKRLLLRPNDRGDTHGYHTVTLVERRILVDMTVAQASAPQFGFTLEPCMLRLPFPEPIADDYLPDIQVDAANDDGIPFTMRWIAVTDRDWEDTPAWEPSHLWWLIERLELDMWNAWLEEAKERLTHV